MPDSGLGPENTAVNWAELCSAWQRDNRSVCKCEELCERERETSGGQ